MLELRGQTFDFEVTNPDHLERFENAYQRMQKAADEVEATRARKKSSQYIREACQCVLTFLDEALGEGAAERVFGGSVSLIDCSEVSSELAREVMRQLSDAVRRFSKFSPSRLDRHRS